MCANDYPVDYIENGYVVVFMSTQKKIWKAINYADELQEEVPILSGKEIIHKNTFEILPEYVAIIIEKKPISKYHIFMKDYMLKSDKSIPYKLRFKDAVEKWHISKKN
jgi:hypothetical protein